MNLTLPYPPSANAYWRTWQGRILKSSEARKYQATVRFQNHKERPLKNLVRVEIDVYRPRRIGDLDNCIKVLLDALRGIAFEDDDQVVEILATRHDDKENPRAEVRIEAAK